MKPVETQGQGVTHTRRSTEPGPQTGGFGCSGQQVSPFTCSEQQKEKPAWLTVKHPQQPRRHGQAPTGARRLEAQGLPPTPRGPEKLPGRRWALGDLAGGWESSHVTPGLLSQFPPWKVSQGGSPREATRGCPQTPHRFWATAGDRLANGHVCARTAAPGPWPASTARGWGERQQRSG